MENLKWFEFRQNNSGGYFEDNENVCEYVLIQAKSAASAISKAEEMMDNSDSCPCCGDRWDFDVEDKDGTDSPTIYGQELDKVESSWFRKKVILHYANGGKTTYIFNNPA